MIISHPKELTPKYLTEILSRIDRFSSISVEKITIKNTEFTLTSEISFLEIDYSEDSPKSAPKKLLLKTLKKGFDPLVWGTEVEFYNLMKHQKDLFIIPCFDAQFDEKKGIAHIILEDISDTHFMTEWSVPPPYEFCEMHITALAKFHAFWWDNKKLGSEIGEYFGKEHFDKHIIDAQERLRCFIAFLGDRLSTDRREILESSVEFAYTYQWERFRERKNLTLVLGDTHPWNALYPKEKNDSFYFIDWQFYGINIGPTDLTYLMGLHWYPERRARYEMKLLKKYYQTLVKSGVKNYTWENCLIDYRASMVYTLQVPAW